MRKLRLLLLFLPASLLLAADDSTLEFVPVASGFSGPTQIAAFRDGTGRFLISEHRGTIQLWDPTRAEDGPKLILDIRDRVWQRPRPCCDEQGLLGLTFPPGQGAKTFFFVSYVDRESNVLVSRFPIDPETGEANSGEEVILQKLYHPDVNHFGGTIAFSPVDGLLYWSIGDGSSATEVVHAQNPTDPFGKILRFNPYADPVSADNPYPPFEVYAMGMRNPWRFSFDQETGDLFVGDVGENTFEELNHIPAGTPAGVTNFGWGVMEGFDCYEFGECNKEGLALPVFLFDHDKGCSISAGEAYYGSLHPEWRGRYFFADFCKGTVWSTAWNGQAWDTIEHVYWPDYQISTFGLGEDGEIYVSSYTHGAIFRLNLKKAEEPAPDPEPDPGNF